MASLLTDEQFDTALAEAQQQRDDDMRRIAKIADSHAGETIQGKSGVDVLRGILSARGWDERPSQVQMTEYIDQAHSIEEGVDQRVGIVAISAPVGTGKTLGYLAPALARGERVIIATSTKALQDQIVGEELPRLREDMLAAFGKVITFTVMKGKGNYPCLSHVDQTIARFAGQLGEFAATDGSALLSGDSELDTLRRIAQSSRLAFAAGDIVNFDADLALQTLSADTRKSVTAKHACPSRKIDLSDRELIDIANDATDVWRAAYCQSMSADIVVMNTALLVEEVRKQGNKVNPMTPCILEGVGMVVIDEAHHAPNIVTSAYSAQVSLKEALRAATAVDKRLDNKDYQTLTNRFFDAIDQTDEITRRSDFHEAVAAACHQFIKGAAAITEQHSEEKSKRQESALSEFQEDVVDVVSDIIMLTERKVRRGDVDAWASHVAITFAEDGSDITLSAVPVDVSFFRDRLVSAMMSLGTYSVPPSTPHKTVVLCSGTINANVPRLLGFGGGSIMRSVESPFDPQRARLCIPSSLPDPTKQRDAWERDGWTAAEQAIRATNGRTLFLCTSNSMVQTFAAKAASLPFQVLKQGDANRSELIRRFSEDEHSVLFATMGYWEGLDVPGPALSLVVIDKIPFPVPSDAIATARRKWVEAEGGNPFAIVDVGHASIMLAQGAGRLIRSEADAGGVLILDSRLVNKSYGSNALAQIDRRWLTYKSLDPFLDWMQVVAEAVDEGDLDAVLDHPRDAQPLRARAGAGAR